jgi:ribosomal protein S18 acetylase RimI-like enzyme
MKTLHEPDFQRLASWVHRLNRRPDGRARCLHSEQGDSVDEHLRELQSLPADERLFIAEVRGRRWFGVVGCEFDVALSRAWTRAPLVDLVSTIEAAALRVQLLSALVAALPGLKRFDAFIQNDELDLLQAHRDAGFVPRSDFHVMRASDAAAVVAWPDGVLEADAASAVAAAALHDAAFPATYLTPQAMLASLDGDHRLLVVHREGAVAGYCYVKLAHDAAEGYVDFLAVDERWRGQGLGRALLQAALHWTLRERRAPQVDLTVEVTRAVALGLYLASGFRPVSSGTHLVLERDAPHA